MNKLKIKKTLRSPLLYQRVKLDSVKSDFIVDFKNKDVKIISDGVFMDSLEANNKASLWRTQLNPLGKKLAQLLDDEVHSLKAGLFATNANTRIKGKGTKGKTKLYTPFMLVFNDGQVLTAQARNTSDKLKKLNAKKPMYISHWFLNEEDITDLVASDDPSIEQLAQRLKKLIEKAHYAFIKKNGIAKKIENIKSLIQGHIDRYERIKELQAQYDANLIYSGDVNTRSGAKVLEEKLAKNRVIEAELKELGGEVPKPTSFVEPTTIREGKQVFYINLSEDDAMKYGKEILWQLSFDKRLKDVSYKIQFDDERGFKQTIGDGLGEVKLDSIDDVVITTSKEPTEQDEVIKEIIKRIVIKATRDFLEDYRPIYNIGDAVELKGSSGVNIIVAKRKKSVPKRTFGDDYLSMNNTTPRYIDKDFSDKTIDFKRSEPLAFSDTYNEYKEFNEKKIRKFYNLLKESFEKNDKKDDFDFISFEDYKKIIHEMYFNTFGESLQRFGAGHGGGVDTVIWDRDKKEYGDYKRVGTIDKGHAVIKGEYQDNQEAIEFAKRMGAKTFEHDKTEITPENIAEFYPSMSDEEKAEILNKVDVFYNDRFTEVIEALKISSNALRENSRKVESDGKVAYIDYFGVIDRMQPVDEYIEEIKQSKAYRDFIVTEDRKAKKEQQDLGILTLELQQKVTNKLNPNKSYSPDEVRTLIQKEINDKMESDKNLFQLIAKNQDVLENKIFKIIEEHGFMEGGETIYNFDKFNTIASSREFKEQLEELEEQLDSDGVIDDHEEELNNLLDKLAELMKKERE